MTATRHLLIVASLAVLFGGCSPRARIQREVRAMEDKFSHHAGFLLYDPTTQRELAAHQSHRYFIPASNTKILTLYTAMTLLGDSLPALRYKQRGDSLICWGAGDPTFLYRHVHQNGRTYDFLKNAPQRLFFSNANWNAPHLGPGWSWDDYNDYYSAERSPLPIYGNIAVVSPHNAAVRIQPRALARMLVVEDSVKQATVLQRDLASNILRLNPGNKGLSRVSEIPLHQSVELTVDLMSDTLHRIVEYAPVSFDSTARLLRSMPVDSAYRVLMQDSDNFIAEQLLLQCGMVLSDTLSQAPALRYMELHDFADLPDPLHWVDGSGLSRYNLLTPANIVAVWKKLDRSVKRERLFPLLVTSGKGTMGKAFQETKPFIWGKTGSMSGNYSISGFLVTRRNRVLLFSFMNSNFIVSTRQIRQQVEQILTLVRDKY